MKQTVRVAAVAVDTCPSCIAENLEKIDYWAGRAAADGAQLVLFPELSLTGFIPNHPTGNHEEWLKAALKTARTMAVPASGPAVASLIDIAAQHQVLVSAGLLEDAGNLLYNTQVLVDGNGLLGSWRKMHVPMFEAPFYNGGGPAHVVETPLGRIGVNICFDVFFPESTRLLALDNAEIVLCPFAADPHPRTPQGWADWAGPALRARCSENGVFGVACNTVGEVESDGVEQTFPGGGMVVDPRGQPLSTWSTAAGEPGMLVTDLEAKELLAARSEPEYLFPFRRPELYGKLAE